MGTQAFFVHFSKNSSAKELNGFTQKLTFFYFLIQHHCWLSTGVTTLAWTFSKEGGASHNIILSPLLSSSPQTSHLFTKQ